MPEISRFFGLIIAMYFDDHNPPHFHVRYNDFRASISIADGALLSGDLPRTALNLVEDWRKLHIIELDANWEKAKSRILPDKIKPLD